MIARSWLVLSSVLVLGGSCGGGGREDKTADAPAPDDGPSAGDGPMRDASDPPADAASIGPACGATTCTGTEVCCIGSVTTCKAPALCPSQSFQCDGAEDCAGGTCCFGNGGQGGSECQTGTNCGAIACHDDGDCGGATPACCPKPFSPGYKVCLAQCL
jgi:hypothetical protein